MCARGATGFRERFLRWDASWIRESARVMDASRWDPIDRALYGVFEIARVIDDGWEELIGGERKGAVCICI